MDYEAQAAFVLGFRGHYNVARIGIDTTGIGAAVASIVERQATVTRYNYTPLLKATMVMQCQQAMRKGRLQFDAGWSDLAQSFLAIRKEITAGGRAVTFSGGRNQETGHADLAWALMHALNHEPIEAPTGGARTIVEVY